MGTIVFTKLPSWSKKASKKPYSTWPTDVASPGDWVVTSPDGARVYPTRDAGKTWNEIAPNGLPAGVTAIDFASGSIGWGLIESARCAEFKTDCTVVGELRKTIDGGQTWEQLHP